MELWIMKLGGSIVTEKQDGAPAIRTSLLSQLCSHIAHFREENPDITLLLLHGAGSIGHPLAKEYDLSDKPLDGKRMYGMAKTVLAMRGLSNAIASTLQEYMVPAIPLQTGSMMYRDEHGQLVFSSQTVLENLFVANCLPVLPGDVVSTSDNTSSIASADELAVVFAQAFHATRILFATDVDGVYPTFPPTASESYLSHLTRDDIQHLITQTDMPHHGQDVTKGMEGKLRSILPLESIQVSIFNGLDPENVQRALRGESVGTTIEL